MVHSDYAGRCQACGRTFTMSNGESQVYVVHVVPPRKDVRTNNFGDLLGLCGWHYSLVRYGQWCFLDSEDGEPFVDSRSMRDSILNAPEKGDSTGNRYISLRVRFSSVSQGWMSVPATKGAEIRYSIPHWTYLCELFKT